MVRDPHLRRAVASSVLDVAAGVFLFFFNHPATTEIYTLSLHDALPISGSAARDYLDTHLFSRHGIEIEWHDYVHPVYPQLHGDFVPYLSIVDLLFNCGEESPAILGR